MKEIEWWIVKVYDEAFREDSRIEPWEQCPSKRAAEAIYRDAYRSGRDDAGFRIAKVTTETLPVRKKRNKR